MFRTPQIFAGFPGIVAAESTRSCGNLGLFTEDEKHVVMANRKRFFADLGFRQDQAAHSYQCHSDQILLVDAPVAANGYDALITDQSDICLSVTIADCTPVLLYDPPTGALAAIHAGWRGTVAGIVKKTVLALQQHFAVTPASCLAYIGTCIDFQSFEVGEEVAVNFASSFKKAGLAPGKYYVDLKGANREQLLQAGLQPDRIETSPYSTVLHNEQYFSHRKEKGKTGRLLAVIGKNSGK